MLTLHFPQNLCISPKPFSIQKFMASERLSVFETPFPSHDFRMFFVRGLGEPPISTFVTYSDEQVTKWIRQTRKEIGSRSHEVVVALGAKWNPDISDGGYAADILQICFQRRCLIVQFRNLRTIPEDLLQFLNDRRLTFVGVSNSWDLDSLKQRDDRLRIPSEHVNLGKVIAQRYNDPRVSFSTVVLPEVLRSVRWSEWGQYELTLAQVLYASVESYKAFEMGMDLQVWNRELYPRITRAQH